jgi:hypothetical protein
MTTPNDLKAALETMQHFRLPFYGDKSCMKIFDADMSMVADIRGWGYLTGQGSGGLALSEQEAIEAQEKLMNFIVLAANAIPDLVKENYHDQ